MVIDHYRAKKKQPQFIQLSPKLADNISICDKKQNIISNIKEMIEEIENVISELPPKAKEAAELILIEYLSYEEAAQKTNCSVRIFYKRFYKGLKIIQKYYSI